MDDHSSTQSFSSHPPHPHPHPHHHHHQLPPCHLAAHDLQGPDLGYPSSQAGLDPLEERGSRKEDPFLISSPSPGGRRVRPGGGGRGLLNASGGGLNGDVNRLDGEIGMSGHFPDIYGYCSGKREDLWEEGRGFDGASEYFYNKGNDRIKGSNDFHVASLNNNEGMAKYRADKTEAGNQQTPPFVRSVSDGQEYCRTNSSVSDTYGGRDEDYGSSCGSGEDHLQPPDLEGPWFSGSPPGGPADARQGDLPQHSPLGVGSGAYHQKLVSFSDAFLSQRKRIFPMIPGDDSARQIWEFGPGGSPMLDRSRQSCAFDPDPYLLPASSSSPFHSSLASFPSPPTSSSLVSAVLSPPLTPRPPPSFSPAKMDSPAAFGGTVHPASHGGGDSVGALQVLASYHQSLPSVHTSGVIWKLPLMAHNFAQSSAAKGDCEGDLSNLRLFHSNATASQNSKAPETLLTLAIPPAGLCPPTIKCLPPSYQLPTLSPQRHEAAERPEPCVAAQSAQNGPAVIDPSQGFQIYTGTPFPSILRSGRGQKKGHYTPRPLLNPARRGKGLYFNLSPQPPGEAEDVGGTCSVFPYVNIGHEFQAELPPCALTGDGSARWATDEEAPREQLLWKPRQDLEDSTNVQNQVEKLLSVCSSSCLPGGGSNAELALHCLHQCQGDTMATLEMLLFSQPSPAGDYHYSGSDFWTNAEKSLFNASLGTYGKEFSLIQKTVKTKSVLQCVEFFYLNKRLHDKQEKQKLENQDSRLEQQAVTTPNSKPISRHFRQEEVVSVPSLAGLFPCKLCGKMFYKIKSRNAHMKIHRQPQEDWTDRRLQHQLIAQRSGGNQLPTQVPYRSIPTSCLPGATRNVDIVLNFSAGGNAIAPSNTSVLDPGAMATSNNNAASNSHVSTDTTQREHPTVVPFYQSWGSFGPDSGAFYCNAEGKDDMGAGALGAKEPIKWQ